MTFAFLAEESSIANCLLAKIRDAETERLSGNSDDERATPIKTDKRITAQSLVLNAIRTSINPKTWGDLSPDDSMCFVGGCLIVHQSEVNLLAIESLLKDLSLVMDDVQNEGQLDEKVTFNYDETPFIDILEEFNTYYGLNVLLDGSATDDSLREDQLVTFNCKDIEMGTAMRLLLDNFNSTYVVRGKVVRIISKDVAGDIDYFRREVINCRALLKKIRTADKNRLAGTTPESVLLKAIKTGASPRDWGDLGADDSMCLIGGCLVVHQSETNLRRIKSLLKDLSLTMDQK